MSFSYPRATCRWRVAACVAVAIGAVNAGSAGAADTYLRPQIEIRAESHDNYGLDVPKGADATGVVAQLGAVLGVATPRSDTSIRPRIDLQEFSGVNDEANYEAFLDLVSEYHSERSEFDLGVNYSRRDANNPDAQFDPLDPNDPTTPETGSIDVGEIRQRYEVRPTYAYRASERVKLGGELAYDGMRYSSQAVLTRVDYDYLYGDLFSEWALDQRSDVRAHVFASNYDAKDGINETDAYGAGIGYGHRWSEQSGLNLDVFYEHDDIAYSDILPDESTSGWGATLSTYYRGQVDRWRFAVGRTFTPNAHGGKSTADQIRLQYDRDLSQRLKLTGAARYVSDQSIGDIVQNDDRKNARVDLRLRWMMTPTWYITGGYSYRWQDRERDPDSADDNAFLLGFGYEGLERRTR